MKTVIINFDLSFWTSLIVNFLISSCIFIACYSFFYIQNRNKKFINFIKKRKWFYYVWLIFISITLSSTVFLSNLELLRFNNIFLASNIFIFSIIFTPIIGWISLLLILIVYIGFYFLGVIKLFTLLNTVLLIGLFLIFIFLSWILRYKNNFLILIYTLLITLLMNLNILFLDGNIDKNVLSLVFSNISIFVYILFIYSIAKPFTRFIVNARNINDRIYMKNNFILNKYFNNFFKNFRDKTNIQYGILFVMQFSFFDEIANKYGASIANKIKIKILNQTRELFSKNEAFYFITKSNEYAFLIKTNNITNLSFSFKGNKMYNRDDKDPLKEYENLFKLLPTKLIVNNDYYNINLKINTAIYGVQSNDINELIEGCSKIHYSLDDTNLLFLYDENRNINEKERKNKNNILTKLNLFKPDEISISFNELKINNKNYISYHPIIINKLFFNWSDILNIYDANNINDAIVSHISAKALKNIEQKDALVLIYYHTYSLSNKNFSLDLLLQQIKDYNINNFAINIVGHNNLENDYLISNIKKMLKNKIKVFVSNNDNSMLSNFFKVKTIKYNEKFDLNNNLIPRYEIY